MLRNEQAVVTRSHHRARTADAIAPAGPDSRLVDAYFGTVHSYWHDVYESPLLEGAIYRKRHEMVLRYIDVSGVCAGKEVLEVGCGSGLLTQELARRAYNVCAIDSVPAMIELTRDRLEKTGYHSNVSVEKQDVHQLGLPSERYDMAVAVGVLPWLASAPQALSELRRVLRPGGVLILTADNAYRLGRLLDPMFSPLTSVMRRFVRVVLAKAGMPRGTSVYPIPVYHSPREVDDLLRRCGFVPERSLTTGFGPCTLLGKNVFGGSINLSIHLSLERVRASYPAFLRWSGNHYVVAARRVPFGDSSVNESLTERRP